VNLARGWCPAQPRDGDPGGAWIWCGSEGRDSGRVWTRPQLGAVCGLRGREPSRAEQLCRGLSFSSSCSHSLLKMVVSRCRSSGGAESSGGHRSSSWPKLEFPGLVCYCELSGVAMTGTQPSSAAALLCFLQLGGKWEKSRLPSYRGGCLANRSLPKDSRPNGKVK
jgi:hypothetical protein